MIHYHGTPITPNEVLISLKGKHFFVSYFRPDNIGVVGAIASTFAIDNGAFSAWTKNIKVDWEKYKDFVKEWERHPAYDWHVIPDIIDGTENENDKLIECWDLKYSVPVWHLHESFERLKELSKSFHKVAIGSSGEFAKIGTQKWWDRMNCVMRSICISGQPSVKLHGMRMLDNKLRCFPFHSADSTNVAQNLTDISLSRKAKAQVMIDRIESCQSAPFYKNKETQLSLFDNFFPETANKR